MALRLPYGACSSTGEHRRPCVRSSSLLAFLVLLTLAAPASAQRSKARRWARSQENRVGLELDLLSTSIARKLDDVEAEVSTFGLGFAVVGQLRVRDWLCLDVEIPFAYGDISTTLSAPDVGVNVD